MDFYIDLEAGFILLRISEIYKTTNVGIYMTTNVGSSMTTHVDISMTTNVGLNMIYPDAPWPEPGFLEDL